MPLTKQEAADFLGVSPRTIEAYVSKGKLTPGRAKGKRGDINVYDETELQKLRDERGQITFVERSEKPTNENPEGQPQTAALARLTPSQAIEWLKDILATAASAKAQPYANVGAKILLSLPEAAELCSLSVNYLRESIKSRKLKAKIIGRGYKVKRTDLELFIKNL